MERGYSDCRNGKLDKMDPSEIYPRRINAKEALITQKGEEFMLPFGRTKLFARGYEFREPNPRQEKAVRSESLRGQFQGEQEGPQPTESKDDAEARKDFWAVQGDSIDRHHNEPGVELCGPNEETFPIPLIYIDVTTDTHESRCVARKSC